MSEIRDRVSAAGIALILFATPAVSLAADWPVARVDPRAQVSEGRMDRHPPNCPPPAYSWNPLHREIERAAAKAACEARERVEALAPVDAWRARADARNPPDLLRPLPGIAGAGSASQTVTR